VESGLGLQRQKNKASKEQQFLLVEAGNPQLPMIGERKVAWMVSNNRRKVSVGQKVQIKNAKRKYGG
jgi:hypothetical protein